MILQQQKLSLVFGPLDTKPDKKTLDMGRLQRADNVVVSKGTGGTREYAKRTGRTLLAGTRRDGTTCSNAWRLASYKGTLVSLNTLGATVPLDTYSTAAVKWAGTSATDYAEPHSFQPGPLTSTVIPIRANNQQNLAPDVAVVSPCVALVAWAVAAVIHYGVYDIAARQMLWIETTGGDRAKCVKTGGGAVLVVSSFGGGAVKFIEWSSPANLLANTKVGGGITSVTITLLTGSRYIDAILDVPTNHVLAAVFASSGGISQICVIEYTPGTAATATTETGIVNAITLGWLTDAGASGRRFLGYASSAIGVNVAVLDSSNAILVTRQMDGTAISHVANITGHSISASTTGEFVCLWDVFNVALATRYNTLTHWGKYTVAGGAVVPTDFCHSVGLRSRTWAIGTQFYVICNYDSDTQPAYVVLRVGSDLDTVTTLYQIAPVTRFLRGLGGPAVDTAKLLVERNAASPGGSFLTNVYAYGNDWIAAVPARTLSVKEGASYSIKTAIDLVQLTKDSTAVGRPLEAADVLMVPAGDVLSFDGIDYAEDAPLLGPETVLTSAGVAGGAMTAGTYQFCACYRFQDAQGRIHRSAPSAPVSLTVTANQQTTLAATSLRIGGRFGVIAGVLTQKVQIEFYRTIADGTTFYLLYTDYNDPTIDASPSIPHADGTADSALSGCEILYTQGDQAGALLSYDTPPQFRCLARYRNRVWGVSADNPREIWYSQPDTPGLGTCWSEEQVLSLPEDCTGLASMDDRIILFAREAMYAAAGDGPDRAGRGLYGTPIKFSTGVGAIASRGIVETADGVWFPSAKGIYLVDRTLTVQPLAAAPVDDYAYLAILDGVHDDAASRIRFYATNGSLGYALVYDYQFREWFVWNGQTIQAAAKWGAVVAQVSATASRVSYDDSTLYTDEGAPYKTRIKTGWLNPFGIGGYGRIYEIVARGTYVGVHNVEIGWYYDGVDTETETREMEFPSDTNWLFSVKPARQKCSSFALEFRDFDKGGGADCATAAFKISGMGALIGIIPTLNRSGQRATDYNEDLA